MLLRRLVQCLHWYVPSPFSKQYLLILDCQLIAFVYAAFLECPALVYSSELFPGEWRAFGVSTSISISFIGQLIFTVAAPTALRTTGAYFYVVFIGLTAIQFVIALVFFPNVRVPDHCCQGSLLTFHQTKGFTLEQMSAVFGDVVVDTEGNTHDASDFVKEHADGDTLQLETAHPDKA